jgi:ATP-dependent RNA helicase RhlB
MRSLPPKERRQTTLFSATLSKDVMNLAAQWMPDPIPVEMDPEQVAVDSVDQVFYSVAARDKFKLLYNMLQKRNMNRVLVFGNRRTAVQRVADTLQAYGIPCELMSGAVPQNKRMRLLDDFRSGRLRVVVATDVAARGLHIEDISHVINFDLPYEPDSFVHRIGRTGRAGATGTAVSFACEDESFIIPEIETFIGHPIKCQLPEEDLLSELPPPVSRIPRPHSAPPRDHGGRDRGGFRRGPPRGGSRGGRR